MKKRIARLLISVSAVFLAGYIGVASYRLAKNGFLHLLEKILRSQISYESYRFNPLGYLQFSKFTSSPLRADSLEIRFNILDLLFRRIESISGKNVYLNIDTLVTAYSKGGGGGGVPPFQISRVIWDSTVLVAGGITFRSKLLMGSMEGVKNTLIIPFKALNTSFLDNTYRIVTSTVKVFKDSTVLYDIQADSRKIFVRNGRLKITSDGVLSWTADSVRYENTSLKYASGSIRGNRYIVRAKKSNILGKYPVNSLFFEFTTRDFNTMNFKKFEILAENGTISGFGSVSGLKKGTPYLISYDLNLNVERVTIPEKEIEFSGNITLTGTGPVGRFNASLRNVCYMQNSFRQLNLTSRFNRDTLFIDSGEIIDPDLNLNFKGLVATDTQSLRFSGSGYNLASYLKKPFSTGFFRLSGNLNIGKSGKQAHITGFLKDVTLRENVKISHLEVDLEFVNGNTSVFTLVEKTRIGNLELDSVMSKINLSSYHMGMYDLHAFSGEKDLLLSGKFYLDSSGVYVSNERLAYTLNRIHEETLSPVYFTWSKGRLNIQADTLRVFKGVLKNLVLDVNGDSLAGTVFVDSVDVSLVSMNSPFKNGVLSGNFEINGNLLNPEFSFRGSLLNAVYKNLDIDTIRSELIYSDGRILSPITVVKGKRFAIYSDFVIPAKFTLKPFRFMVKDRESIHGELVVDRIDATIMTDILEGGVYPESGFLQGNLMLLGSLKQPELSGKLEVRTSNTFIEALGNEYGEIYIQMNFRDQRIEIPQIRIEAREGYADGKGTVMLEGIKPGYISILLNLSKFPLARGDIFEGLLSGFISIQGTPPDDITVSGDLFVEEGYVYLSFGKSGGSGKMRPNPLKINLRVRADRRVFLVNELADMEFSADLTIVKEDPVTVLVSGNLNVIKGTFLYLDRTFIIQEGSITFSNEPEINPTLNLTGETVVNDTIFIELHVTGNVKTPEIQLTSSPPLPEEDIISLLSFGKLLSEVPLTIRDINLMKTRALNLAEGLISRELQKRLRINELELRTGLAGENPRFTVGLYLSPRVYFKYAHSFEALEKDVYQVKYFLRRNFAIYGERDREGEISIGIEARYRF